MALDYGSVRSYSERGFGFVTRTLDSGGQDVFFHIRSVRRKYPDLADDLDLVGDACEMDSFWYETESTEKGEQVRDLWLTPDEIPEEKLSIIRSRIEQVWRESQWRLPDMVWVTRSVFGEAGCERLAQALEDRLREQLELAERRRRSEAEERRREIEREADRLRREAQLASERPTAAPGMEPADLHSKGRATPWSDEDREWQEALALEKWLRYGDDASGIAEPPISSTWPHQTPSRGTASTESGSSDRTGWWYEQLKGTGGPGVIDTRVVGVTYENRQSVVKELGEGEQVWLCREPTNPHD